MFSVSILIPCFNCEQYLPRVFASLEKQTYQDFECIFINDGSTDHSRNLLEAFKVKYPERVTLIHQANAGISAALNAGMEKCRGEYIAMLDSDDYLESDYIEKLYTAGVSKDADVIISGLKKVSENIDNTKNNKNTEHANDHKIYDSIDYPVDIYPDYCLRRLSLHGKMYKREYIKKHHLTFPVGKIYEDNAFNCCALFLSRKQVILTYNGYRQTVHTNSLTGRRITNDQIPYDAYEQAIAYTLSHGEDLSDHALFEFTVLSFFTYFIFQANRKQSYIKKINKSRKSDAKTIDQLCDYVQNLIPQYFPAFADNPHIKPDAHKYLSKAQRYGVWLFVKLIKHNKLKTFARFIYKF